MRGLCRGGAPWKGGRMSIIGLYMAVIDTLRLIVDVARLIADSMKPDK
jgi:hypothetical protein